MRIAIVDPPAYTPPYDRSLAAGLARAGGDVELLTSHFVHGPVPPADGYRVTDAFYRRSAERIDMRGRRAVKGAEHLGDMPRLPHGAFDYLTRLPDEAPLPDELAAVEGPVILFFGLIRPYKGVDVLLEAFAGVEGAELWIVGRPLGMELEPLIKLANRAPARVRFVSRFVADNELPAFFRRAD